VSSGNSDTALIHGKIVINFACLVSGAAANRAFAWGMTNARNHAFLAALRIPLKA
jgi:hypothetical protein